MNITILVNRDLPSLLALNYLLPNLLEHRTSVFYSQKAIAASLPKPLLDLANFEGQVLLELDKSGMRNSLLGFKQLQDFACNDIRRLNAINDEDYRALQQSDPELIVSIRHMTILRERVISLPTCGVINLHSGILPTYQGVMSTFRAMYNKERIIGTSLHYIEDQEIDKGAIISQSRTTLQPKKSYLWNVLNLYKDGCQLVQDAIEAINSATSPSAIVQEGSANYYSYPKAQDLADFFELGFKLFEQDDPIDFQNIFS